MVNNFEKGTKKEAFGGGKKRISNARKKIGENCFYEQSKDTNSFADCCNNSEKENKRKLSGGGKKRISNARKKINQDCFYEQSKETNNFADCNNSFEGGSVRKDKNISDTLDELVLKRAKGGDYIELSEDFELKNKEFRPVLCKAGEKIILPFGEIDIKNAENFVFKFFDGEFEKVTSGNVGWLEVCDEKSCDEKNSKHTNLCKKIGEVESKMVCVKRKVSKKYNPPDMSAVKLLLELNEKKNNDAVGIVSEIRNMSNSELEKRKAELVKRILGGDEI